MKRREFPRSVKVDVIKRCTRENVVYCEKCNQPTHKFQIDHAIADSHGGKPVIGNAQLLCEECYLIKNPEDTTTAAKLKRIEAKDIGATQPKQQIRSRGFAKSAKTPRMAKESLPPRALYKRISNDK